MNDMPTFETVPDPGRRTVLVTGASRGIGSEIARALAEKGFDLLLTCEKNMSLLSALSNSLIEKYGVQVRAFACDAGSPADTAELFEAVTAPDLTVNFQKPSLLCAVVNNAGAAYYGLLQDMSDDEWHRIMSVNLDSVFYTSRAAIPLLLKTREYDTPRILNVTSVWGEAGAAAEVAYSAAKGGVIAFTRALAKELAPSGISVNALSCGVIDTSMNAHLSIEEKQDLIREIPADRFGTPKEAADAVVKLMEMPAYMTGQIVRLDGGFL